MTAAFMIFVRPLSGAALRIVAWLAVWVQATTSTEIFTIGARPADDEDRRGGCAADLGMEFNVPRASSSVANSRLACLGSADAAPRDSSTPTDDLYYEGPFALADGGADEGIDLAGGAAPLLTPVADRLLLQDSGPSDERLAELWTTPRQHNDLDTASAVRLARRLRVRRGVHTLLVHVFSNALQSQIVVARLGDLVQQHSDLTRYTRALCTHLFGHVHCQMYAAAGVLLLSWHDMLSLGGQSVRVVLVSAPQHFVWPVVDEGHSVRLYLHDRVVSMRTLSIRPRVFEIEDLLSASECEHIIRISENSLQHSRVGHKEHDQAPNRPDAKRNSHNTWVGKAHDAVIERVERRLATLMRIPYSKYADIVEDLQVVRYEVDELYDAHHDYYPTDANFEGMPDFGAGRNRMLTVLVFLQEPFEGGETNFPRAGNNRPAYDCSRGLLVAPKRGKAVLFYNLKAQGHMEFGSTDEYSLHIGCRVIRGTKWVANAWMHNWVDGARTMRGSVAKATRDSATKMRASEATAIAAASSAAHHDKLPPEQKRMQG